VVAGLVLGGAVPGFSQASKQTAEALSDAFASTAKSAMPAVVSITVEKTIDAADIAGSNAQAEMNDPFGPFGDEFLRKFFGDQLPQTRTPRKYVQRGQGSGFIISRDGYILTNNHVVGDVDRITVELQDGRTFTTARVIGTDPDSEVALIKLEGNDFPVLPLGDSNTMDVGDWVIAVGNPFGLSETVTVGVVSAVGRSNVNITAYEDFIQTDAAINPGNSGGPLINLDGQVIGINTAIASQSGGYMGIGFAIPINMAQSIAQQLRKTGRVVRGYLGLYGQDVTADMAELLNLPKAQGVLVAQVEQGSPAAQAGLQPGDVILEMNGRPVESYVAFRNQVAMMQPGEEIQLGVSREGKTQPLTVTLGERPGERQVAKEKPQPQPPTEESQQRLGIQAVDLTPELAQELGYQNSQGVVVSRVFPGSPADQAGLRAGDLVMSVNRKPITNTGQLIAAMKAVAGEKVLLLVKRGEMSQFAVIDLTRG
jgi:serine protease Do